MHVGSKIFIVVMLQLGPLRELSNSWEDGEYTPRLIWYIAAEGLGEAPMTGVLTAYILTFGAHVSITFYVGVLWSFISITKAAVKINFYHKNPGLSEQVHNTQTHTYEGAHSIIYYLQKTIAGNLENVCQFVSHFGDCLQKMVDIF